MYSAFIHHSYSWWKRASLLGSMSQEMWEQAPGTVKGIFESPPGPSHLRGSWVLQGLLESNLPQGFFPGIISEGLYCTPMLCQRKLNGDFLFAIRNEWLWKNLAIFCLYWSHFMISTHLEENYFPHRILTSNSDNSHQHILEYFLGACLPVGRKNRAHRVRPLG